jgi:DNA-directed RNA polymerase subunit alpha
MENIPIAKKIEFIEAEKSKKSKGSFVIEPLYPGYGLTLGNALRRVLLSSLSGAAIVAVKIKGAEHEFSTLDYVKEDVVDIIMNLKQIRFKLASEELTEELKISLKVKGEKQATAGDFEKMAGLEIINKDLVIATLTDKAANLEIEAYLGYGRGYDPIESRTDKDKYEIGVIAIDALYSPVKRVGYEIESVRVGQMTNWDKIILNLETDGTISCEDAFVKAVEILVAQFSALQLAAPEKEVMKKVKKEKVEKEETAAPADEALEVHVADVTEADKPKKRGRPKKEE